MTIEEEKLSQENTKSCMIRTSSGTKIKEVRRLSFLKKKKITCKTEGRQSFCLAVGEVQKAGDIEYQNITETFS